MLPCYTNQKVRQASIPPTRRKSRGKQKKPLVSFLSNYLQNGIGKTITQLNTTIHEKIGIPFDAKSFPVEILSLSEQDGVKLRATVSEFGPVLLSRILNLSETQEGIVAVIFKYCDDHKLEYTICPREIRIMEDAVSIQY